MSLKQKRNSIKSKTTNKENSDFVLGMFDELVASIPAEYLGEDLSDVIDTPGIKVRKLRNVEFDESKYRSTKCMNNTIGNQLEGDIIVQIIDEEEDVKIMEEVLEMFENEIRELTPVGKGILSSAIFSSMRISGNTIIGTVGVKVDQVVRTTGTGREVYYAIAVHNAVGQFYSGPPRATWGFVEKAFENEYLRQIAVEKFNG